MQMSEEMAVRLHRMMWSDMQKELGDNLCSGRATYKEEWLDKHFPGEHFMHNCFLCEYVTQQTGNRPLLGCAECKICPIKWPGDNCSLREREGGVNYLQSPISDILMLPARNPEIEKFFYDFKTTTDENGKISVHALLGDLGDKIRADMSERLYNQIKECLAVDSGLPASATVHDHVKWIKEKAVQQSNLSKIYGDTKMELAKASGLPAGDTTTDHIKAIQEKAVDDYFARMPLAKAMTTDIDEVFKQHAEEQMAPVFKVLSEASGLSESNHNVRDHINRIIFKTRNEADDDTRKFMAKYSGELWNRLTVAGHIGKIQRDANEKNRYSNSLLEKYKNALSNESGLNRDKPIDIHLREIVKNSMEAGAAEERDRIQEKIYEVILS